MQIKIQIHLFITINTFNFECKTKYSGRIEKKISTHNIFLSQMTATKLDFVDFRRSKTYTITNAFVGPPKLYVHDLMNIGSAGGPSVCHVTLLFDYVRKNISESF